MSLSKPTDDVAPAAFDDAIVNLRKEIITNRFRRLTSMSSMAKILAIYYNHMHLVLPHNIQKLASFFQDFDFY